MSQTDQLYKLKTWLGRELCLTCDFLLRELDLGHRIRVQTVVARKLTGSSCEPVEVEDARKRVSSDR